VFRLFWMENGDGRRMLPSSVVRPPSKKLDRISDTLYFRSRSYAVALFRISKTHFCLRHMVLTDLPKAQHANCVSSKINSHTGGRLSQQRGGLSNTKGGHRSSRPSQNLHITQSAYAPKKFLFFGV
jgi:hypothetical protein